MYTIYDYSLALVSLIACGYFSSILTMWLFVWYKFSMEASRDYLSKSWFGAVISVLTMYGISELTTADYIVVNHMVVFLVMSTFVTYRAFTILDEYDE